MRTLKTQWEKGKDHLSMGSSVMMVVHFKILTLAPTCIEICSARRWKKDVESRTSRRPQDGKTNFSFHKKYYDVTEPQNVARY